jgi:hypothetical protein
MVRAWLKPLGKKWLAGPSKSGAPRRQRARLRVEALEDRWCPTVLFEPHFAGEALIPGTSNNALNNTNVFLLFEGAYWGTTQGQQDQATMTQDAQTILNSSFLSGLSQYTASKGSVQASLANSYTDLTPLPSRFFADTSGNVSWTTLNAALRRAAAAGALSQLQPLGLTTNSPPPTPLYVFVTDPNVSSGVNWGGYNEEDSSTNSQYQLWIGTGLTAPTSGVNMDNLTSTFSHELAESMSNGVQVNLPATWGSLGDQIADGEPEIGAGYCSRLSGVLVQAYWSQKDSAFIVPNTSSQTTMQSPVWNGTTFTGQLNTVSTFYRLTVGGKLQSMVNGSWTTIDTGVTEFELFANGTLFDLRSTGVLVSRASGSATWTQQDTGVHEIKHTGNILYDLKSNGALRIYKNGTWGATALDTGVHDIAVLDGVLYDLETNGQLWTYQNGSRASSALDTNVETIAVTPDYGLFDLEASGDLWEYENGTWYYIDAKVQTIAVGGDGNLYELMTTGDLWQFRGGTWNWQVQSDGSLANGPIDSGVQSIVVGGDGSLYELMTTGDLWQYRNGSWGNGTFDSGIQTIAVGGDGSLYELTTTGYLWQYQFGSWVGWIDSGVKSIVVDGSGALYDLETNGQLWKYQFSTWSANPVKTGVTAISVSAFGVLQVQP